MTSMNAAVVTSFAEPPCYQPFDVPQPRRDGAVGAADYLAELPPLISEITAGRITVTVSTVPLADVEQAWTRQEAPGERTVLIP